MYIESKRLPLLMCFLTWFASAFIFVQIPALTQELKPEVFPSTDLVTSILMVAVTFSISLVARFLGGLIFGIYSNTKGIKIILIPIISLAILTFCQILLFSYYKGIENSLMLASFFIIIRVLIGFCIGGIWPNLGIFTLEEYYRISSSKLNPNANQLNKEIEEQNKEIEEVFRKEVQKYGFLSALIQNGLTSSYLIEGAIIIALTLYSDALVEIFPISYLVQTQFTSIVGLVLLCLVSFYWFRYFYYKINSKASKCNIHSNNDSNETKNMQYNEYYSFFTFLNGKKNSLWDLLINRKYRFTLLNLWFITTGLMYMYYSTVIVTPELLYRRNLFPFQQEYVLLFVAIASLIGHIFLGFFYRFQINFVLKDWLKRRWKNIQRWYSINDPTQSKNDYLENKDIFAIFIISILIIIFVVVVVISYSFVIYFFQDENTITHFMVLFQLFLAFIANTPWALIPSILTSRFPKHFRFLAGSLAYNGGLIISFASPFFIQQVILDSQNWNNMNYYLVLLPMLFGGFSIMWGSWRLLRDFLPKSIQGKIEYGYFEIRIPLKWETDQNEDEDKGYREKIFKDNSKWLMSIYFFEGKNKKNFFDYDIRDLLKELVEKKVEKYPLFGANKEDISEFEEEDVYINSTITKKKSFFIKDKDDIIMSLIIPYSKHVYIILFRKNENNSKENNLISKVIDTFDIKIPLREFKIIPKESH